MPWFLELVLTLEQPSEVISLNTFLYLLYGYEKNQIALPLGWEQLKFRSDLLFFVT